MQRLIRSAGLVLALAATPALAQTPEPPADPAPPTADAEAAEEAPPAEGAPAASDDEAAEETPADIPAADSPVEEPAPSVETDTVEPPPDGGPLPSEDRPSEPVSPEDELAPAPAPAPPADEPEMQVPVLPVRPPPDRAVEANPAVGRANRFMDVTTTLTDLVSRNGPFAVRPGFGGVADELILRGATGTAAGDLTTTIDGIPIAIPFAGRGTGFTDLEHIPVAAIDRFRTRPGPFDGSYAGSVALHTRQLSGVEGGLMLGEGHRRLSLAAGRPNMMMAVELRRAPHELAGVTDERFSTLARASHQLADDLEVGLLLRAYSDAWDEPGTVPRDEPAMGPERDPTDGGKLWGLGAGFLLGWTPSTRTRLDVTLSFLDDGWTRWSSSDGAQLEEKNRDRVWYGGARLQLEPQLALPTRISLGLDVGLDRARARSFATNSRERVFLAEEIYGDWLNIGGHGSAEIEFIDGFFVGAMARADQLTVRREDAARSQSPDTRRDLLPSGALWLAYRAGCFGAELEFGAGHRTAPDAMRGDNLAVDHYGLDLTFYGRVALGEQWRLDWQANGFASLYEAGLFSETATGEERQVWGAEARLDLEHVPSGLLLVGRGGPWFSSLRGSEERAELSAPGVPDYVLHAGLLRSTPRGLVAEVWVDAYGGHALTAIPGGGEADSFIDVSARAGFRGAWGTLWIGAINLLDEDGAVTTATPDRLAPRPGRAVYAMLDVQI